ncbi:monocarboxylate transporter 14-like [Anastrepha ludens]|uniref:monocarboxylate transporter 14-like n=1 Tax=Anastrepha ludens TaxID=28586 RepID=UPI0023B15355|nr:monocarboxylate transporter 14-like [Anastrepha ludens]XP_053962354.1 monocarboxylate transporter 14-like [Anastrepha ludens]
MAANQTNTGSQLSLEPAHKTIQLNKPVKHNFFPEVKFSGLPVNGDHLLKNCLITIEDGNGGDQLAKKPPEIIASKVVKKQKSLILNESHDSMDSSSADKKKPEIPDGGYGYVIVVTSLVISLITDGLGFSFGLLNSELLDYFGESPSKTAWISSLFFSVPLLMGPIWSNLVDKYGCCKMTIFGGLLSSIGFGLSSLCNSVEMLMLTFGIISGLGLGIGYVTLVVSIAFWFDKKRTFATGIAASGSGIGTLLYAPLTQSLIDSYGWRSATLILAGTILNICICGVFMRDPDWLKEEKRLENRSQSVATYSNSSVCTEEIKKEEETKKLVLNKLGSKTSTEVNQPINDLHKFIIKPFRSEIFLPTFSGSQDLGSIYDFKSLAKRSLRHNIEIDQLSRDNSHLTSPADANPTVDINAARNGTIKDDIAAKADDETVTSFVPLIPHDVRCSSTSFMSLKSNIPTVIEENSEMNESAKWTYDDSIIGIRQLSKSKKPTSRTNLQRNTLTRHSNFPMNIRLYRNPMHYHVPMLNTHRHRQRANSCPIIYRNSMTPIAKKQEDSWYGGIVDTMKAVFDFSLFSDMKFTLFNISTLFLFMWFTIPYLYLPEYLKIHGYETGESAHVISVIGIAQTIGMIGLGYVGDRPWMNINICYSVCMVVCGISVLLMPILAANYSCLVLMCITFGFTFASSYSFTPSICVSIVDLNDFTCAYGLVLLVQGLGIIAGPPMAGAIYEMSLRWDHSFYFAGVFIVLSGVAAYLIEFCEKRENNGASAAKKAPLIH